MEPDAREVTTSKSTTLEYGLPGDIYSYSIEERIFALFSLAINKSWPFSAPFSSWEYCVGIVFSGKVKEKEFFFPCGRSVDKEVCRETKFSSFLQETVEHFPVGKLMLWVPHLS